MYKKEWWVAVLPIQLFWLSGCRHRHGNASTHFHVETPSIQNAAILELLTSLITFRHFYNKEWEDALKSFTPRFFRSLGLMKHVNEIEAIWKAHVNLKVDRGSTFTFTCFSSPHTPRKIYVCSHVKITWQWKSTFTIIKCINSMLRLFFDSTWGIGCRSHIPFPCLGIDTLDHILNAWKKAFNIEKIISMLKERIITIPWILSSFSSWFH